MPIAEERALQAKARKEIKTRKGIKNGKPYTYKSVQEHRNAVVFGHMVNEGWRPNRPRGRA